LGLPAGLEMAQFSPEGRGIAHFAMAMELRSRVDAEPRVSIMVPFFHTT
jgi:hypothetical protein